MPVHEQQDSSFERLVLQMLGDLKEAAVKHDDRIRQIENARLTEAGFKSGATWLAKLIYTCLGGLGLLAAQAIMKHLGWL